jgi:alpha-ketoglutarate-dependent taurine dioxygenase
MNHYPENSPFNPANESAYLYWRSDKLARHPVVIEELLVRIHDPFNVNDREKQLLHDKISQCNMAIYQIAQHPEYATDKSFLYELGKQFGLKELDNNLYADEDAISSLKVTPDKAGKGYIPYTNRPIAWHTDGYYNTGQKQVRAMLLHCVTPAAEGGKNQLLDHEMAYLMLRDKNPAYIEALSRPDAMSIPANIQEGKTIRDAVSGPVFSTDDKGHLHMRYTARTRSIEWLDDPMVLEAKEALLEILKTPSPYHFEGKLEAGQGLICNNVLHTRTAFEENSDRMLYRARYFDRISEV